MSDKTTTVAELISLMRHFTEERDWGQFHHPKDLGLALAIEVGELLEHFRYRTNEEISHHLETPVHLTELSHEIADCVWLLLRLADVCGFDMSDALRDKLQLAAAKYPVEKVRGRPDKYTAYLDKEKPGAGPEGSAS